MTSCSPLDGNFSLPDIDSNFRPTFGYHPNSNEVVQLPQYRQLLQLSPFPKFRPRVERPAEKPSRSYLSTSTIGAILDSIFAVIFLFLLIYQSHGCFRVDPDSDSQRLSQPTQEQQAAIQVGNGCFGGQANRQPTRVKERFGNKFDRTPEAVTYISKLRRRPNFVDRVRAFPRQ